MSSTRTSTPQLRRQPLLKVFLYDYDAVEILTDVKVRTNRDRCEGEEDVPAWFFEDGVCFYREIDVGCGFRTVHCASVRDAHGS